MLGFKTCFGFSKCYNPLTLRRYTPAPRPLASRHCTSRPPLTKKCRAPRPEVPSLKASCLEAPRPRPLSLKASCPEAPQPWWATLEAPQDSMPHALRPPKSRGSTTQCLPKPQGTAPQSPPQALRLSAPRPLPQPRGAAPRGPPPKTISADKDYKCWGITQIISTMYLQQQLWDWPEVLIFV